MKAQMIRQAIKCSSIGLCSFVLGMVALPQAHAMNFYLGNGSGSFRSARSGSYSYSGGDFDLPSEVASKWGLDVDSASNSLANPADASSGFQLSFQKTVKLATTTISMAGTDDVVVKSNGRSGFGKSLPAKIAKKSSVTPFGKVNGKTANLSAFKQNNSVVLKSTQVQPVPEPLTILGSGLALGAGVLFERKRKKTKDKV